VAVEVKAMEIKKQQEREGRTQEPALKKFKVREWVEEIKREIKTIQWTSKDELRLYTQIVVGATFVFGMGVYLIDLVISGALHLLTWLSRLLVG
jgi:preprotein translocase subunit SecE